LAQWRKHLSQKTDRLRATCASRVQIHGVVWWCSRSAACFFVTRQAELQLTGTSRQVVSNLRRDELCFVTLLTQHTGLWPGDIQAPQRRGRGPFAPMGVGPGRYRGRRSFGQRGGRHDGRRSTDLACGRGENAAAESKQISGLVAPRVSAGSWQLKTHAPQSR
jgi:hypothetical protein